MLLKTICVNVQERKHVAGDRSGWKRLIWESCNNFDPKRIELSNKRCAIRKGEIESGSALLGHQHNCSICGNVTRSTAGLTSHVRSYQGDQVQTLAIATLPERPVDYLCKFCDRFCKSVDKQVSNTGNAGKTLYLPRVVRKAVKVKLALRITYGSIAER